MPQLLEFASAPSPKVAHVESGSGVDLPIPPGSSSQQLALGNRLFHGNAKYGTCSGCHGGDGKGSNVGPDLTNGHWEWTDGSLSAIRRVINDGVPKPKNYSGAMPPRGGAPLSRADVSALAAYVWAISHPKQ